MYQLFHQYTFHSFLSWNSFDLFWITNSASSSSFFDRILPTLLSFQRRVFLLFHYQFQALSENINFPFQWRVHFSPFFSRPFLLDLTLIFLFTAYLNRFVVFISTTRVFFLVITIIFLFLDINDQFFYDPYFYDVFQNFLDVFPVSVKFIPIEIFKISLNAANVHLQSCVHFAVDHSSVITDFLICYLILYIPHIE